MENKEETYLDCDTTIEVVTAHHDIQNHNYNKLEGMQDEMSLVRESIHGDRKIPIQMDVDDVLSIHRVFVKMEPEQTKEECKTEECELEEEEVIFQSMDEDGEMLPVILENSDGMNQGDGVGSMGSGDSGTGFVSLEEDKMKSNVNRIKRGTLKYKVLGIGEDSNFPGPDSVEYQQKLLDKNDPLRHLHYIKYIKHNGRPMKIWECGICSKEFRHQYTLVRHLPTHTDERNFKCETCGKAFRQMSTLSQHRAIHSDARPYVCEFCKKTFNRVSTLISHRKTHSEQKPHKCEMCGKGFHQKGNLRNHVFTHTNERPYKCTMCSKGFNQMSNLMCHKAHTHGDKLRYVCNLCQKEFPRRFALRSHEEYKHGIKYRGGERRQELDPTTFEEIMSRKQKKRDEKNLKIIQLPNGDRTLADIRDLKNGHVPHGGYQRPKNGGLLGSGILYSDKVSLSGVIINPITTKAMQIACETGQTPFALLRPVKGIPVLVKVIPAANNKQMLMPATAEDLKSAGKVTVSPHYNSNTGAKALQIRVPVVATVTQKVGEDGQINIIVESPETDHQSSKKSAETKEGSGTTPEEELTNVATRVQYIREDGTLISPEEMKDMSAVNMLANVVSLVEETETQQEPMFEPGMEVSPDLLELASKGEITFVRPSVNGTYEELTQEEAARIMQNPCQTLELFSNPHEEQKSLDSNPDCELLENQSNLNSLVEAIRSAGYRVTENTKEIVISDCSDELILGTDEGAGPHIMFGDPRQMMLRGDHDLIEMVIEDSEQVQYVVQDGDANAREQEPITS